MAIRITDDKNVAFYNSTSMLAFGPIFESESDAEAFEEWLEDRTETPIQNIPLRDLESFHQRWCNEQDNQSE